MAPGTLEAWLGGRTGGLSGPAIRPFALAQVRDVAAAVSVPVIGMGGIESGADALAFVAAGATAVAVGTANFRDPLAAERVRSELEAELLQVGSGSLSEVRGRMAASTST
jgi:dihydroorotate dehydrogenase (NAD+) catalytic subunit